MIYCIDHMNLGATNGFAAMGITRKTITVTDQQDAWIKARIEAGGFTNDSEYIRDLIRRDQARDAELMAIHAALEVGERSGAPRPFDAVRFKKAMVARHAGKAR
jgi:antitoxin ParD1/3/4